MARLIDRLLVCAYVAAAALPVAAMTFELGEHTVNGALPPAPRPELSFEGVKSEDYQTKLAAWFESNLGLKGYSIFIDNTILFHALGDTKLYAPVKIGLDDVLFLHEDLGYYNVEAGYESAHLAIFADKIAGLQAKLRARGRAFVPVIIPSKTTIYRDKIPARWTRDLGQPRPSDVRLYTRLKQALEVRHIAFVDARSMFLSGVAPRDDLWGPTARHWSRYGACLAMREVVHRYRDLTGRPLDYECVLHRTRGRQSSGDYDLLRLANAWFVPHDSSTPGVDHVPPAPGTEQPSLMCIGTSFCSELVEDANDSHRFGSIYQDYYNRTVWRFGSRETDEVKPHTPAWRETFLARDVYIFDLLETYLTNDETFLEHAVDELASELP